MIICIYAERNREEDTDRGERERDKETGSERDRVTRRGNRDRNGAGRERETVGDIERKMWCNAQVP